MLIILLKLFLIESDLTENFLILSRAHISRSKMQLEILRHISRYLRSSKVIKH